MGASTADGFSDFPRSNRNGSAGRQGENTRPRATVATGAAERQLSGSVRTGPALPDCDCRSIANLTRLSVDRDCTSFSAM